MDTYALLLHVYFFVVVPVFLALILEPLLDAILLLKLVAIFLLIG